MIFLAGPAVQADSTKDCHLTGRVAERTNEIKLFCWIHVLALEEVAQKTIELEDFHWQSSGAVRLDCID